MKNKSAHKIKLQVRVPGVVILCATLFEMSHFLDLCPYYSSHTLKTGQKVMSGKMGDRTYDLVITGPGVFNSVHALSVYLCTAKPSLVLNTGIAGLFKQTGCQIGDVAIATREHYIHTGVQAEGITCDALPFDLIEACPSTRKGIYVFDQNLVSDINDIQLQRFADDYPADILSGPFITVSTITSSFAQADRLHEAFSSVMEAMEGAAFAHVAAMYNIPMIEIRSASNYVGDRKKSNWDIDLAVKHLGQALALL